MVKEKRKILKNKSKNWDKINQQLRSFIHSFRCVIAFRGLVEKEKKKKEKKINPLFQI